jgi:hypothetical protein
LEITALPPFSDACSADAMEIPLLIDVLSRQR